MRMKLLDAIRYARLFVLIRSGSLCAPAPNSDAEQARDHEQTSAGPGDDRADNAARRTRGTSTRRRDADRSKEIGGVSAGIFVIRKVERPSLAGSEDAIGHPTFESERPIIADRIDLERWHAVHVAI